MSPKGKNMKVFVGNLMKLAGKTRHGKNRIRENGDMWRVITVDSLSSLSNLTTKVCVRPMDLERRDEWRWIDLPSDEHMEIVEHIE